MRAYIYEPRVLFVILGSRVVFTLVIKNRIVIEKRSKPDLSISRFRESV